MRKVIVSISGGNSSAVAAKRAIDKYGREAVELVFCNTLIEDDDLYRFLGDVESHLNMPILRLTEGRTPLEVAVDEHIIPNQMLAKCSDRLKVEVMRKYVAKLQAVGYDVTMVIGFDYRDAMPRGAKKEGRLPGTRQKWAEVGVTVDYPLLDEPKELDSEATIRSWGIEPPRMYAMGYTHNNCGGCCVKQGKKDWRRTLKEFPERYRQFEEWEKMMRQNPTNAAYTFLRDGRAGYEGRITLEQLRLETEAASLKELRLLTLDDDMGEVCGIECGVA